MQSPPEFKPKRIPRSNSQSPPPCLPPFSLDDILEFESSGPTITAFEQQMKRNNRDNITVDEIDPLKHSGRPVVRRKAMARGQFGRSNSMTISSKSNNNNTGSRSLLRSSCSKQFRWRRNDLSQFSGGFLPEEMIDDFSLSARKNRSSLLSTHGIEDDDDGISEWPVPTDLVGALPSNTRDEEQLPSKNSRNRRCSLARSRRLSRMGSSSDETLDEGNATREVCSITTGTLGSNEFDFNDTIPARPTGRKLLSRSETLPLSKALSTSQFEGTRGPRRTIQRSMSISGRLPQRSHSISTSMNFFSSSPNHFPVESTDQWILENVDASSFNIIRQHCSHNTNESIEHNFSLSDDVARSRKKIRARRHSIQGELYIAPLTQTRPTSSCTDPALDWFMSNTTYPSQENLRRDYSEGTDTVETAICSSQNSQFISSPSNRSVASSRKRGVCGNTPPSSDVDDLSSAGFPSSMQSNGSLSSYTTRTRNRIFCPSPGTQFPAPPTLHPKSSSMKRLESESESEDLLWKSTKELDPEPLDDSDDDASSDNSSPDVSMDNGSECNMAIAEKTGSKNDCLRIENVFENMSSYDDLKFIIKSLRKESNDSHFASFGIRSTWNVAPPVTWSSQRRNKFFEWVCKNLGFTMRSAGMSVHYIQIPKGKGGEILRILEAALVEYKLHEKEAKPCSVDSDLIQHFGFGLQSSATLEHPHLIEELTESDNVPTYRMSAPSPAESITKPFQLHADSTLHLTSEMQALSMAESSTLFVQENRSSLSRMVTIDPSVVNSNAPRPSMGSHCSDHNFMLHLHGAEENSPQHDRWKAYKPPKLSIDSIHTTASASSTYGSGCTLTPFAVPPTLHPIQNLEFLATPLMNEPRGWGSRPVSGKDWGDSEKCEDLIILALKSRFEQLCALDPRRDSCSTSNALEFEGDAYNLIDEPSAIPEESCLHYRKLTPQEETKMMRKRVSAFNKRRRMSLWAAASQSKMTYVPGQSSKFRKGGSSFCPLHENYKSITDLSSSLSEFRDGVFPQIEKISISEPEDSTPCQAVGSDEKIMAQIFSYLNESALLRQASTVCSAWADMATAAHANLMLASVGIDDEDDDSQSPRRVAHYKSVGRSMERSWKEIHERFPWACYLAEGGAKRVYKVHNKIVRANEAVSVMDTFNIQNKQIVANELAISVLLSSLARRGICPNFVMTRGVFTCAYKPSESHWGSEVNKEPKGNEYDENKIFRLPREPKNPFPGRYQYIRMELINEGDAEELIKRQPNKVLDTSIAQAVLFQVAFALHAAADRFSVKHYDIKLLNVFLQKIHASNGDVVMRYGFGSHIFALRMPSDNAFIAKLADFGTANINSDCNGQPITIAQFTTIENTPPDFMILGDEAKQGHGHDHFCLGLCMLHLFTGSAPYEEILEDVKCPVNFKKRLRRVWEGEDNAGYSIICSLIQDGVVKDDAGHVIEGEPDETFYDTLYRFLVLFGIPPNQFQQKKCPKVWNAISDSFGTASMHNMPTGRPNRKKSGSDLEQYKLDCKRFSLRTGTDSNIARARGSLQSISGGMDLLFKLCSFDPSTRASAIEVLNSQFMENLREQDGTMYHEETMLYEYTAFSTHHNRK